MLPLKKNVDSTPMPPHVDGNQEKSLVPEKNNTKKSVEKENNMIYIWFGSAFDKSVSQSEKVNIDQSSQSQLPLVDENKAALDVEVKISNDENEELHRPNPREKILFFLEGYGIHGMLFNGTLHKFKLAFF